MATEVVVMTTERDKDGKKVCRFQKVEEVVGSEQKLSHQKGKRRCRNSKKIIEI